MTWVDHIPGGLADEKSPDDFDPEALAKGTEVELEHTDDPQIATEVAMDHLTEDPKYYDKLEVLEKKTAMSLRKSVQAFELRLAARNLQAVEQYRKLSDAAEATGDPRYAGRGTEIWYVKPKFGRDFRMGPEFLKEQGIPIPTQTADLTETHILLGEVGERDPEEVYEMMQGEFWSPEGQARGLISRLGLHHTSMSVGDVLVVGDRPLMVDNHGFERLASRDKKGADEIDIDLLPPDRLRLVNKIPYKPVMAWDGIHGYIVEFDRPSIQGGRFTKAFLKTLTSDPNFRWIENQRSGLAIGM